MSRYAVVLMLIAALAVLLLPGCGREQQPTEVETTEDILHPPAPSDEISQERAREIVARATGADADDVTIMADQVSGGVANLVASIPAHEDLLPLEAGTPGEQAGADTPQQLEAVEIRWDLKADRPTDILWTERLQFADEQPVETEEAVATARELKQKWFPDVPAEMVMRPPHPMNRPVFAIVWRGRTEEGVLTGDHIAVQVSAVTGLPIAYTQRVAEQRPSPDDLKITRQQAIGAVRAALTRAGVEDAEETDLTARLILSGPMHPEGGPVWVVAVEGLDRDAIAIDAMTGEPLADEPTDDER